MTRALCAGLLMSALCAVHAQNATPQASPSPSPSATVPSAALPDPSPSARELFSRYKDRLLQVRVLLNSANEQSALGSGFVVQDDGAQGAWVLTNYHVISSLAMDPDKYRIELRGTNGRNVKAQLMALDVIHDLAVLRIEATADTAANTPPWNVFKLRESPLTQGSKIFSLGNPLELGFLISEGIYNGLVESRVYDEMLFSGALNSGMSGGPAIDEQGQVVGVNVATRRDGEQLSFLVPVRYARDVLALALSAPPSAPQIADWRKTISHQLLVHQDFLTTTLFGTAADAASATKTKLGFSTQTLAGRAVPTLGGGLTKCWANGLVGEKQRYQRDTLDCNLRSHLFVRGGIYTGTMSLQHVLLRNDKLTMPQFLSLEAGRFQGASYARGGGELTAAECRGSYVQPGKQPGAHVYRVSICLRAYRKFSGIYDYDVSATQMDDARERQTSRFQLNGFSFDNGQRLTRQFLERLQ